MKSFKYNCEKCKFVTNTLNNYNIHLSTKKHTNPEIIECKFECIICNKKYKGHSGLWRHKRLCKESPSEQNTVVKKNSKISNEVIEALKEQQKEINEKQNQTIEALKEQHHKDLEELKKLIIELTKKEQPAPITNNDNKLNINLFLNEQCKNAINMMDFVKSIVFELKDFENLLDKGYIENKTNIILENLNKLTLYERPLHYEKQEEVIHIRDDDKWKKETEKNKPILENAIYYANEKEYMNFFEVYKKKTNGDIREDKDFEVVKKTLIKDDNDNSRNEIMENILEKVKI